MGFLHFRLQWTPIRGCGLRSAFYIEWASVDSYLGPSREGYLHIGLLWTPILRYAHVGFLHIGLLWIPIWGRGMSIAFYIEWDSVDSYMRLSRMFFFVLGSCGLLFGAAANGVSTYWAPVDSYLQPRVCVITRASVDFFPGPSRVGFLHVGFLWTPIWGRSMCVKFYIEWASVDSYISGAIASGVSSYWALWTPFFRLWYVYNVLYRLGSCGLLSGAVAPSRGGFFILGFCGLLSGAVRGWGFFILVFLDAYLWPWYVFNVLYRMGSGGLIFGAVTLQPKQRTVF